MERWLTCLHTAYTENLPSYKVPRNHVACVHNHSNVVLCGGRLVSLQPVRAVQADTEGKKWADFQ